MLPFSPPLSPSLYLSSLSLSFCGRCACASSCMQECPAGSLDFRQQQCLHLQATRGDGNWTLAETGECTSHAMQGDVISFCISVACMYCACCMHGLALHACMIKLSTHSLVGGHCFNLLCEQQRGAKFNLDWHTILLLQSTWQESALRPVPCAVHPPSKMARCVMLHFPLATLCVTTVASVMIFSS